jgi:iron uptake system component EfeO
MRRVVSLMSVTGLVIFVTACGSDSKSGSSAKTLEFTVTDEGCSPSQAGTTPGSTNFHVKNTGADNITEFEVLDSSNKIVGEKENLTPGLEGSFTIDLEEGSYTIACPGGTKNPTGTLTVSATGAPASASAVGP